VQFRVGPWVSTTNTVVVQLELLPSVSVMLRVTVCKAPTWLQSKLLGLTSRLVMPQAAVLPPSMLLGVILAVPLPSNITLADWQMALGAPLVLSMVTVAVQLLLLPFASVVVRVTVCGPTSLQLKVFVSRL